MLPALSHICRLIAAVPRCLPALLACPPACLPPCRLGLPDYALLQSAVGAANGGYASSGMHGGMGGGSIGGGGMGGGGMHNSMGSMGSMRGGGGTPPLDTGALSAQVNLAGFGLGGLGNGESPPVRPRSVQC